MNLKNQNISNKCHVKVLLYFKNAVLTFKNLFGKTAIISSWLFYTNIKLSQCPSQYFYLYER